MLILAGNTAKKMAKSTKVGIAVYLDFLVDFEYGGHLRWAPYPKLIGSSLGTIVVRLALLSSFALFYQHDQNFL